MYLGWLSANLQRDWVDQDIERIMLSIAELARRFLHLEMFAPCERAGTIVVPQWQSLLGDGTGSGSLIHGIQLGGLG